MSERYTRPNAESSALILIDVQRDFYEDDAPARIDGTSEVIPAMADLASAFRERNLPIVHVVRLYLADGSNVDIVRRSAIEEGERIVSPGSAGSQIAPPLLPDETELAFEELLAGSFQELGPREHVMYKPRWGAFYETRLEQHLRDMEVDTLVFAGCNFPNCPRTSMYEASERDFRVAMVSDAMSGVYERGVKECRNIGVTVRDMDETMKWLSGQ